ncbi:NAD(+) diphosphatase [Clostridium paridis]|nr:NAD(+) diphosphatase [Clostridium paridis]
MNNIEEYLDFVPGVVSVKAKTNMDLWFVFNDDKVLTYKENEEVHIPTYDKIDFLDIKEEYYIGSLKGTECYACEISEDKIYNKPYFEFIDIRSLGIILGERFFLLLGRGKQIINWDKNNRFCGKCGSEIHKLDNERAKKCDACGTTYYPQLSPAIIVSVIKGEEILLAHNLNFKEGLFSVIAGFVEAGETFEESVKREVMEEVGIKVNNIKYFGNQPWPFPNSVMIGFTAEYESGEIKVDGTEIGEAKWFKKDKLPDIPNNLSIARKLIDEFLRS